MRTHHGRGIAFGLTVGALVAALACVGCSGSPQGGTSNGAAGQNASVASNVEASNATVDGGDSNAGRGGNATDAANAGESSADSNGDANANSNVTAVIIDADAEDAQGVLPDGWYLTSLTGTDDPSSISAASVSGDTWTLTGSLTRAESEDALYGDASQGEVGPGTWKLKVESGATLEAGSNPKAADHDTFETTLTSLNGLGLVLHVEGGQVTYARLAS